MPKRIQVPLDDDLVNEFEDLAEREARPLGNMGMILIREAMMQRKNYQDLSKSQLEGLVANLGHDSLIALLGASCNEFLKRQP